jgi:DivIVA domain-containing protein
MPDERHDLPSEVDEALAARLTDPTDTLPDQPRAQVADPSFALALRGYDRAAVDAYVERVTRIVSELEATRSPREAVRQALERVGEETTDILRRAHDTGEEITSKARAEADELRTRTKAETEGLSTRSRAEAEALTAAAAEDAEKVTATARRDANTLEKRSRHEAETLVENAKRQAEESVSGIEQRLAALDGEVDSVWSERQRLIGDIQQLSRDLRGLAREAEVRFPAEAPPGEPAASPVETVEMSIAELPDAVPDRS